jgi:hypothetical protein
MALMTTDAIARQIIEVKGFRRWRRSFAATRPAPAACTWWRRLIGVDPDYRVHVSDRLLELHDGPFLELGLKKIGGQLIKLPRRAADYPDTRPARLPV